jgi:hypothetical protein
MQMRNASGRILRRTGGLGERTPQNFRFSCFGIFWRGGHGKIPHKMLKCSCMSNHLSDLKKNVDIKLSELRTKRKGVVGNFKKKLEEAKIEQIKNSILNK